MGDPAVEGPHSHGASSQYGSDQWHVHGGTTPVTVDTTAKSGIKEQKKSETESERIAKLINLIIQGKTEKKKATSIYIDPTNWTATQADTTTVDTITDVTDSDVDIMLNEWTEKVFLDVYGREKNLID